MTKDSIDLTVQSHGNGSMISPLLLGHNLEHTRKCIWQGLSAQRLRMGESARRDAKPTRGRERATPRYPKIAVPMRTIVAPSSTASW
jgi:hypothetical protein